LAGWTGQAETRGPVKGDEEFVLVNGIHGRVGGGGGGGGTLTSEPSEAPGQSDQSGGWSWDGQEEYGDEGGLGCLEYPAKERGRFVDNG